MAVCQKIRRTNKRVCIGALNTPVKLQLREIKAAKGNSVDFRMKNNELQTVWGLVETVGIRDFLGDTNTIHVFTHKVYIRYINGFKIDKNIRLEIEGEQYDIIGIENLNEEKRFWMIRANVRGPSAKAVNYGGVTR